MGDMPRMGELADKDDELDGCDADFVVAAITDDDVLGIVFGSAPARFAEYRAWFDALRRRS